MSDKFDLIIFDNDGVLVDSEKIYAKVSAEIYPRFGYPMTVDEYYQRWASIKTSTKLEMIEKESGVSIDLAAFEKVYRSYLNKVFETEIEPVLNAKEMLQKLQYKKCVASSAPRNGTILKYKLLGFSGLFDESEIFSGKDVVNGKPAPDLFLIAAEKMGTKPENCVVIEDSVTGVTAGKAAGMITLGFIGGSHGKYIENYEEKLKNAGADIIFDKLIDLPHILERI